MKKISFITLCMTFCISMAFAQQDWSNVTCYQKQNAELKESPKVVFMGNSITEQWYRFDPDFFTNNNFAGRGIGGQVTSQMLARFRADVINLNPKAVVILAGINDIAKNSGYAISVKYIFENIVSMVDIARANKIKVVLCTLVAADEIGWRKDINPIEPVAELNRLIKQYAEDNKIPVADMFAVTADDNGGIKDQYRMPNKDAVHPGVQGYKAMEQEIMKVLTKIKICK